MAGVLSGIKVIDLSEGISGPMATMMLADHGAEVTRIERPGGDPFRSQLGYRGWNRGKRSAVLDLTQEEDKRLLLSLLQHADVFVESLRPGKSKEWGLDHETLSRLNPELIQCSITGYGRENPHAERPGFDALVAARSGLQWEQRGRVGGAAAFLSGQPAFSPEFEIAAEAKQGPDREGPLFTGSRFPSLGAGHAAILAISAALRAREVTGRGQWVETSLLQGALSAGVMAFATGQNLDAWGFSTWISDSRAPKGLFECSDGRWVHCWPPSPRFVLAAGEGDELNAHPDLAVREDPDRIGLGPEELFVLDHYWEPMARTFAKFTADEWTQAGADAGVCIQKIRSPEEAWSDPLLLDDGCVTEIEDDELGPIRTVGIVYKLGNSPGEVGRSSPATGRDTEEVKTEAHALPPSSTPRPKGKKLPNGPLEGIRVLDFGLAVAGPYGAQLLSDLGADVIKVNALHDWYWHSNQIAMSCNRGKRSIAINLKEEASQDVLHRLIDSADVIIHNMRYPAAIRLGIDYESLASRFPKLVYCHTRGFERGPRELLPGNDQTGACLAGVEWEDGGCGKGGRPLWSLTNMGDTGNGYLAATAICQALFERERTGQGQWVETAIINAQLLNASHSIGRSDGSGFERPLLDSDHLGLSSGVRLYSTQDGWLCLSLFRKEHWQALARVLEQPDLASLPASSPPDEKDEADRVRNIQDALATRSARVWFEELDRAGVPCEIASDRASLDLWSDPGALDRRWIVKYPHPMVGEIGQVGLAFDFSDTPARIQGPPFLVGEHTHEILDELGFDEAGKTRLFEAGAVGDESIHPALAQESDTVVKSPWAPES
ncbi:MAG: CoA transferase [Myxococcota bacterium]|nr:CoA transferase [Myxococcota bacterium]